MDEYFYNAMDKYSITDETARLLDAVQSLNEAYKCTLEAFKANYTADGLEELTKPFNEAFNKTQEELMKLVSAQMMANLSGGHNEI